MRGNFELYKITNTVTGKCYIGQTIKGIKTRWHQHKGEAHRGAPFVLHRAIRKYGAPTFKIEVIANAFKREYLNDIETALIAQHGTFVPNGYNLTTGGGAGTKVSLETREKISVALKGNTYTLGHKLSEAHKRKLSISLIGNTRTLGYKHTDETKRKMSAGSKGNTRCRGNKLSEKHKKNISLAMKGRVGHKHSEASKKKMRGTRKGLLHPKSKGLIHTPLGIFDTTEEASEIVGCSRSTIYYRCGSHRPEWKSWYFETKLGGV